MNARVHLGGNRTYSAHFMERDFLGSSKAVVSEKIRGSSKDWESTSNRIRNVQGAFTACYRLITVLRSCKI